MSNSQNTFVFNLEWTEILNEFSAEHHFEVYKAITTYAATGTVPELSPTAKMAFAFIRREMDYNRRRYEETVAKRSNAGRKGAEATNNKKPKAETVAATASQKPPKAENDDSSTSKTIENATVSASNPTDDVSADAPAPPPSDKGYCVVEQLSRDEFMNDFFKEENRATIDSLCSTNAIDAATLGRLAKEVLDDWQATDQPLHQDLSSAKRHLLSQIRIKLNIERRQQAAAASNYSHYDSQQNDRYARRRGVDPRFNRPEDYTDTI